MSDQPSSGIFSQENVSTILAVTFILALVSLAFNFFIFARLNEVAVVASAIDVGMAARHGKALDELNTRVAELEKEIAEVRATAEAAKAAGEPAPE